MSQISGPGISITFAATGNAVVEESRRVRVEVQETGKQIKTSNESAAVSYRGLAQSVSIVRQALTTLGASVGTAIAIVKGIDAISNSGENNRKTLDALTESSRRYTESLLQQTAVIEQQSAATAQISKLRAESQKQAEELQKAAEQQLTGLSNLLLRQVGLAPSRAEITAEVDAQIAAINGATNRAQRKIEADEEQRRKDAAKKAEAESLARAQSAGKVLRELDARALDEKARIDFEINEQISEQRRNIIKATTEYERRVYIDMIDALEQERDRRHAARIDREAEAERKKQEEVIEAQRRAQEAINADAQRSQEAIAQSISNAAQAMSDAARQLTEVTTDVALIRGLVETRVAVGGGRR